MGDGHAEDRGVGDGDAGHRGVGDRGVGDIRTRMRRALTAAMKARDQCAVTALRSALAAIDNAEAVDTAGGGHPTGEGRIAGAILGVGAAEAARRTLTPVETQAIVRQEVAERQTAAHAYERAGQSGPAERLRAEAEVLEAYLDDPDTQLGEPGA